MLGLLIISIISIATLVLGLIPVYTRKDLKYKVIYLNKCYAINYFFKKLLELVAQQLQVNLN